MHPISWGKPRVAGSLQKLKERGRHATDPPSELQKEPILLTLGFHTSGLLNYKRINFCCLRQAHLQQFVTAAPGNECKQGVGHPGFEPRLTPGPELSPCAMQPLRAGLKIEWIMSRLHKHLDICTDKNWKYIQQSVYFWVVWIQMDFNLLLLLICFFFSQHCRAIFFMVRYTWMYIQVKGIRLHLALKWFGEKANKYVYTWREKDKANVGKC